MKLAHDGVQLSFDIAGAGPLQFLFVHGLGGDRTHFARRRWSISPVKVVR